MNTPNLPRIQRQGAGLGHHCPACPLPNFSSSICPIPTLPLVLGPFGFGTTGAAHTYLAHTWPRPNPVLCISSPWPTICCSLRPILLALCTSRLKAAPQTHRLIASLRLAFSAVTFTLVPAGCCYLSVFCQLRDRFSHLLSPCWGDPWGNRGCIYCPAGDHSFQPVDMLGLGDSTVTWTDVPRMGY